VEEKEDSGEREKEGEASTSPAPLLERTQRKRKGRRKKVPRRVDTILA